MDPCELPSARRGPGLVRETATTAAAPEASAPTKIDDVIQHLTAWETKVHELEQKIDEVMGVDLKSAVLRKLAPRPGPPLMVATWVRPRGRPRGRRAPLSRRRAGDDS